MRLFGSIGIDIQLLFAQIINFGILLWLLSKFIYRPVIRRIEEDEASLDATRTEKEALTNDRQFFEQQKRQELSKIKERSQAIIEEAESIGKGIGARARRKMEQDGEEIIKQAQRQAESLEYTAQRRIAMSVAESIEKKLRAVIKRDLPKAALSDMLFDTLIGEINHLSHDAFVVSQPSVVLEYVVQPHERQKKKLTELLEKKFKQQISLTMKRNERLIAGFSLEFQGIIIESNIANIIHNAAKSK